MSGGSMNYLYLNVQEAEFKENTAERRAFRKHLNLVAEALRAIEWVDSGDSSEDTKEIMAVLGKERVLESLVEEAKSVRCQLEKYLTNEI